MNLEYCVDNSYLVPFRLSGKTVYNVCGIQKGKIDSLIAYGAHFDHLGTQDYGEDTVYNGADDDASGVSAVIVLSDYFKENKPYYSMMYMAFNAEEIGLVGSKKLVNNNEFKPLLPKV